MATIKEIAKYTGVSIGTVDRVLHNRGAVSSETREKVLKAMEKLNYRPNLVAQGLAVCKKNLRFLCFIYDDPKHPFFRPLIENMRAKAIELEAYGVQTTFADYSDYIDMPPENIRGMEDMDRLNLKVLKGLGITGENCDGIAIAGATDSVRALCGKFSIPLVNVNNGADQEGILAYVGADYLRSGRIAMGLTALIGGPDAKVMVVSEAVSESDSYLKRITGYSSEGKERYPGIRIRDVIEIAGSSEEIEKKIRESLETHPDIDFAYIVNPKDYSVCRMIKQIAGDRKIRMITNDRTDEVEELLKEGIVSAVITQQPEIQGSRALEILFQYAAYGKMPEQKIQYTKQEICIAESL